MDFRTPLVVKVGSDFSGLETACLALNRIPNFRKALLFASDSQPACRKVLEWLHRPQRLFEDVSQRDPKEEPYVDLYIATPPCQAFSTCGRRRGLKDPRGRLFKHSMQYIKRRRPRAVVIENVRGLASKPYRHVLKGLKQAFLSLGYQVHMGVLDSSKYQVAQVRKRLFIVAIKKDSFRRAFKWPKARGSKTLQDILDPKVANDLPGRLPKNKRKRSLVKNAFKAVWGEGIDPRVTPVAIDVGCTAAWASKGVNICKTILRGRAAAFGYWVSSRGRPLSITELMKALGIKPSELAGWENTISRSQMGAMLGNFVPVPLIGSVLQSAMYAAGLLASNNDPFPIL